MVGEEEEEEEEEYSTDEEEEEPQARQQTRGLVRNDIILVYGRLSFYCAVALDSLGVLVIACYNQSMAIVQQIITQTVHTHTYVHTYMHSNHVNQRFPIS